MRKIYETAGRALREGRSFAIATVIAAELSTPRDAGAKMIVFEDGSTEGTVGGGPLEALVIDASLDALREGASKRAEFSLDEGAPGGIGMKCGGRVEVFIDVHTQPAVLLILGAGHVGKALGDMASLAGLPFVVFDDREEYANRARFPEARDVVVGEFPGNFLPYADGKSRVVIVTRSHAMDETCLEAALKTGAAYIGMIGSRRKNRQIIGSLKERGLDPERDPRFFAPIGLDLGGEAPGEIALSVLAEIVKLRYDRSGASLRDLVRSERGA